MYDPSVPQTFLNIPKWFEVGREKSHPTHTFLIAVKKDLIDVKKIKSLVSHDEAKKMSSIYGENMHNMYL